MEAGFGGESGRVVILIGERESRLLESLKNENSPALEERWAAES